ncbi:hypothetical protein HPG69_005331 [Diceros bicornis minor]|uniref:Transmembrane protein 81 n=1 Tax=Diceros bicornis minor TaxID=77932 RepID=A0A7J7EM85_DICBM|nr:hypothetical protein HPG69_005331 [Diceros bicornis minor]
MLHFTLLIGKEFELSCLSSDILEVGQEAFRFTWRLARGIISTDDEVFKPFRASSHFVKFESAQEYDSGTYRCDVQLLKNLRLVKRLYFGLRVLPPNLVNLNFHQSLTEDQKLVDEGLEVNLDDYSRPHHPPWKKKVAVALGIGIASGVAGGSPERFLGLLLAPVLLAVSALKLVLLEESSVLVSYSIQGPLSHD